MGTSQKSKSNVPMSEKKYMGGTIGKRKLATVDRIEAQNIQSKVADPLNNGQTSQAIEKKKLPRESLNYAMAAKKSQRQEQVKIPGKNIVKNQKSYPQQHYQQQHYQQQQYHQQRPFQQSQQQQPQTIGENKGV